MNNFNTFQSINYKNSTPSNYNGTANITTNPSITRTSNGSYWVYTFTDTTQTYTMSFTNVQGVIPLNILAVGGGGGGGSNYGGGGGGGGFIEQTNLISSNRNITVKVGAGGNNSNGQNTYINELSINAYGGGLGGSNNTGNGANGGSGGANARANISTSGQGILNQGYAGGTTGGGGGGAAQAGVSGRAGKGGNGKNPTLKGLPNTTYFAGGGGGYDLGLGGLGGGGSNSNGTPNTGGGGGESGTAKSGGSGIVIIAILKTNINN